MDAVNENIEALPRRLRDLGVRYPREREDEFVAELRELFYRYYGASLAEIDPLQVIREAFGLIYSLNLELPARFVLLDRVVATLASVGVELYPDFNVFEVARPYARDLMLRRFAPKRLATDARREAWALAGIVREMPYQVHDVLEELRDGQMEVGIKHKGLEDLLGKLDVLINRLVLSIVVVGGLLGSSILVAFADAGPEFLGVNLFGMLGFAAVRGARDLAVLRDPPLRPDLAADADRHRPVRQGRDHAREPRPGRSAAS